MEYIQCENLRDDFLEGVKTQIYFKKLFSRARESAPSMVILDNIDEITSKKSLKDVKIRKAVYQLLRELERIKPGDRLLITAATDRPYLIEPLLFKAERFDKLLYVPMPDLESRQELFKLFLKKYDVEDDINTKILGRITKGYNGLDIKKVVKYARHLAKEDDMGITMHHLENAVNDIRPSVSPNILEPIKQFFVRNKRGLIGEDSYQEVEAVTDWPRDKNRRPHRYKYAQIEDEEPEFEITIDEDYVESEEEQNIEWEFGESSDDSNSEEVIEGDDEVEELEDEEEDEEELEDEDEVEDWD
jgi:hypothetical protein